jgi:hypothetical protein
LQKQLTFFYMNAFLITTPKGTSEWLTSFVDVQNEMNILEKSGIVSNVKVQKFEQNILVNEFIYNYNGEEWEK